MNLNFLKKITIISFQALFTFGVFYIIREKNWQIDLNKLLIKSNYFFIILAIIFQITSTFIASIRWANIMSYLSYQYPKSFYIRSSFLGLVFNQLLPTSIGGDAVKITMLAKNGISKKNSFYLICIDRFYGVLGLLLINLFVMNHIYKNFPCNIFLAILAITLLGIFVFFIPFIFAKNKFDFFENVRKSFRPNLLVLSVTPNLLTFIAIYFLALSFHLNISFINILVIMPAVIIFSLLPVSFSGWGVREASFISIAAFFSVAPKDSLILSISFGILLIATSIPGLLFIKDLSLTDQES